MKCSQRMEYYIFFSMNKIREVLYGRVEQVHSEQGKRYNSQPYDRIPISLNEENHPFARMLHDDNFGLERKIKVRQIASRQIERHFDKIHCQYRSKENELTKSFNIRTKKQANKLYSSYQPRGLQKWVEERQKALRHLNEEYLRQVRSQIQQKGECGVQKIIEEYNIIYEYKTKTKIQ